MAIRILGERPIAAIALMMTWMVVSDSTGSEHRPLDIVGAATCALGLFSLVFGLIESSAHAWLSWPVGGALMVGLALLVAFGIWEEHTRWPMLPMHLLKARSFATGCCVYLLVYLGCGTHWPVAAACVLIAAMAAAVGLASYKGDERSAQRTSNPWRRQWVNPPH